MLNTLRSNIPTSISNKYYVREITENDKYDLFKVYSNEKVAKYVVRKTHENVEDTEDFIKLIKRREEEGKNIYLGICDAISSKVIGIIRFLEKEDSTTLTIGYALAEEYWGKGIIRSVLDSLTEFIKMEKQYLRLRATIRPENINSQKCAEKCGFHLKDMFMKEEMVEGKKVLSHRMEYIKSLL